MFSLIVFLSSSTTYHIMIFEQLKQSMIYIFSFLLSTYDSLSLDKRYSCFTVFGASLLGDKSNVIWAVLAFSCSSLFFSRQFLGADASTPVFLSSRTLDAVYLLLPYFLLISLNLCALLIFFLLYIMSPCSFAISMYGLYGQPGD